MVRGYGTAINAVDRLRLVFAAAQRKAVDGRPPPITTVGVRSLRN
jgi:hypothetical protein